MVKHILLISQYDPLPQRPDIPVDNRVIPSLCAARREDEQITVLLCHVYRRQEALRRFWPLLRAEGRVEDELYQDEAGNDVILCEHPSVLPRVCRVYPCFAKKYRQRVEAYMQLQGMERFDAVAVHFPTRHTGLAKRIPARRRVAVLHAFDVKNPWRRTRLPQTLAGYDAVGCRAPWIAGRVKALLPQTRTFPCYSGLPAWMLHEGRQRDDAWMRGGVLHLLYAGKLNRNKQVDRILNALAGLREKKVPFQLTLMGDGPERERLKAQAKRLGVEHAVSFTGAKERSEVFAAMRQTDVFVMVSRSETLGLVYLEAMAAGAVTVAAVGRGVDGLVTDGENGFLVSPDEPEALRQLLENLAAMDAEAAARLRESAWRTVAPMEEQAMSRRYLDEVLGNGQGWNKDG